MIILRRKTKDERRKRFLRKKNITTTIIITRNMLKSMNASIIANMPKLMNIITTMKKKLKMMNMFGSR